MTKLEKIDAEIATLQYRRTVIKAHEDGKRIQARHVDNDENGWTNCPIPLWDWSFWNYSIAPEPKIIPWTRDDVPFNAMYRERVVENSPWRTPLSKAFNGLRFYDCFMHYELLADNWEHTTDGKTWKPCHKYEN